MSSVPQDQDLSPSDSVPRAFRLLALIVGALCVSFAVLLLWASQAGEFFDEMALLASVPWGLVAIMDVYLGLLLIALWIGYRERDVFKTAAWVLCLACLGNAITCLYIIVALLRCNGDVSKFWQGRAAT